MRAGGIIWAAIICIPFWLIVIVLVTDGDSALKNFAVVGLTLSGLLLFLILISSLIAKLREKDSDEYIEETPTPTIQPKTHLKDSSGTSTPG